MLTKEVITFITAAECGSFLKASEKLFITPASVMNQINKLEEEASVKLIERTNRGIKLTPAGASFYGDAKEIEKLSSSALEKARGVAQNQKYAIRIGASILRPPKMLVDLLAETKGGSLPFNLKIIPFDDSPENMQAMLNSLGKEIDCFAGPCDSVSWKEKYNILVLKYGECRISVPRKHKLAEKDGLNWEDLNGETLMLVKRGYSNILDELRDEVEQEHPKVKISDIEHFYDTDIFNRCEQSGFIMESLDIWKDVHPSLKTLPMNWNYKIPYGIVYSKNLSEQMRLFIEQIESLVAGERNA